MKNKSHKKSEVSDPDYMQIYATKTQDLVDYIHEILLQKGINQKIMAAQLGKAESEVSKWLSGKHNISLKTIAKLEAVLETEILISWGKKTTMSESEAPLMQKQKSVLFDEIDEEMPKHYEIFVDKSMDFVDRMHQILKEKGFTQKKLAQIFGKSESEISKWLSGGHNLTIKTIAKIEDKLGEVIFVVPTPPNQTNDSSSDY